MSISPGPLRDYQPLASPLLTPAPFAQSPRMWPGPTGMARTSPLPGASFMGNLLTPRAPVTLDSFAEPTKPPLAPGPRGASASASAAAFDQLQAQQQQQQQHLSPAPFAPFPLSANLSSLFFMSSPALQRVGYELPPPNAIRYGAFANAPATVRAGNPPSRATRPGVQLASVDAAADGAGSSAAGDC
eukprot:TRINITY_DN511_c0_g1_i6.p1 TRINITY_DN511_c0_g1~~TRINITY_DN511_c0_g1_i6.p1  ORF type:complete len:187 (+),score=35.20 TRINITY_DN511_c0_g1_i6:703-1263(+)